MENKADLCWKPCGKNILQKTPIGSLCEIESLSPENEKAKYIRYTKDYKFVQENIYQKLKGVIEAYSKGIDIDDNNIHMDKDNLIKQIEIFAKKIAHLEATSR